MKIIVDAMGGDNAPEAIVKGAVQAHQELGCQIILTGRQEEITPILRAEGCTGAQVVDARDVISMNDEPTLAVRSKTDSSLVRALRLLKQGAGDAVVSAGSTGALLTGATLTVKRIRGIRRAALAPVLPTGQYGTVLIDCGANAECSPEYLLQFAYMGSFYSEKVLGCPRPRVGLLNIGTEEEKGDALRHETYALLEKAGREGRICFVGNVEATGIYDGCLQRLLQGSLSLPAQFLVGQRRVCPDGRNITCSAADNRVVQFQMVYLFKLGDQLQHRYGMTCTDVEDFIVLGHPALYHAVDSSHVGLGQIHHVDIIAQTGTVRGVIVVAENRQTFT